MRSLALSLVVFVCLAGNASAVGWQNGVSPDGVQCTSAATTICGVWYRIRQDGEILRRPSGDSTFRPVLLSEIPETARSVVAAQYDKFVPVEEQAYSPSTLRRAAGRPTDSQRTRTTKTTDSRQYDLRYRDSSQHTLTATDSRSYDQHFRDRDVQYRAYTDGAQSPAVIMANNYLYQSRMSVDVHPVREVAAMAAFADNRALLAELIAARREQSQRQEASVTQIVNVNCGGCSRPPCQQQQMDTLSARCWRCGTYFVDQQGRRWQRISGPAMKHSPAQLQGVFGRDAQGRMTFTTTWSDGTTVFMDP